MEENIKVSIIIVNYNTCELLKNCLKSTFTQTKDISFEVIISDNGSKDGSIEMLEASFPTVILLKNEENLGFGKANNRALAVAKGKYIFYLNSDTILLNNAVKIFYDYFESYKENDLGVIGCNLENSGGKIIHSFGQIMPLKERTKSLFHTFLGVSKDSVKYFITRKKEKININHLQSYTLGEVPYVTGADMFLRNNEFARFDERYFMYNEEVDLQLKMHKENLKSVLVEGPRIIHLEGGSTEKKLFKIFYLSSAGNQQLFLSYVQFYKKNEHKSLLLFIFKIIILLIWLNPFLIRHTKSNIKKLIKI